METITPGVLDRDVAVEAPDDRLDLVPGRARADGRHVDPVEDGPLGELSRELEAERLSFADRLGHARGVEDDDV